MNKQQGTHKFTPEQQAAMDRLLDDTRASRGLNDLDDIVEAGPLCCGRVSARHRPGRSRTVAPAAAGGLLLTRPGCGTVAPWHSADVARTPTDR